MQSKRKKQLLKILAKVTGIKDLQRIPGFQEEAARLHERLADDEFRIAVVGEFSSGKSTFINAMLGKDVLQHATTETTAAVTRIVNVQENDPRRMTGVVTMRNGKEILMPDLKNLKEYTTTQSERYQNRIPDEILSVEIYLPFMTLSRPIVLVDTPGLNGMAEGHREQTVALIQKAHACIYLIPRGGLGESDILFLTYLVRLQKNFIFIQNYIDEFRISEGDSVSEKLEEQRKILTQKIFMHNPDCVFDICGVSALMELVSADQRINRLYADSPDTLTAENRIHLHEQSGFDEFRNIMNQNFQEDHMDEIQYGGTSRAIANWIMSILNHISRQEQQAREFFDASHDKRVLEKLDYLHEKIIVGEQRQRESLQNFIIARGEEIRREEYDGLKVSFEDFVSQLGAQINAIRESEKLDLFEKKLPGLLENKVGVILEEGDVRLRRKFQTLYQILLTKIDEYSGIKSTEDLNLESLNISSIPVKQLPFTVAQGRIEKWREELESKKQESSTLMDKNNQIMTELLEVQRSETSAQRAQREIEKQKNRDFAVMGSRPAVEEHSVPYTDYVYRGGFGIIDALFGPKEVMRYRTVRDDSAGHKWDQRRARIQNAYAVKNDSLSKELAAARRRKNNILARQDVNQTKLKTIEEKISQLEKVIALESEKLEQEKRHAEEEHMELRRASLQQQVEEYLLSGNGVLARVQENRASIAEKFEKAFIRLAMDQFTQALQQKLQWIDQMKREKTPEILRQAENLGQICERLQNILKEMEYG